MKSDNEKPEVLNITRELRVAEYELAAAQHGVWLGKKRLERAKRAYDKREEREAQVMHK